MYTPLRYMEQIENMVTIKGHRGIEGLMNRKNIEWFEDIFKRERATAFRLGALGWSYCRFDNVMPEAISTEVHKLQVDYAEQIGLAPVDEEDFFLMLLLNVIHYDWSRNKRVYKIEDGMLSDLCHMTVPKYIPVDTVTKLPAKCFYVDWEGHAEFCPEAAGCFITYDVLDGIATYSIITVIAHSRIIPILTTLELRDIEGAEKIETSTDKYTDGITLTLEDGSQVYYNERMVIKMFHNFCVYLSAVNADVTYTDRTRTTYKPTPEGSKPKNKMREVEEFGVGFRYTAVKPKTVVRYDKPAPGAEPAQKRSYSSNYRSAHWHHFWMNDPENPTQKIKVVKWLEGTFVRGNNGTSNIVHVHEIKR